MGKGALVTGAASGIGRATALLFAREGARVLLADLNDDAGEEVCAEIAKDGGEAHYLHVDVSSEADVEAMVRAAVERLGQLDCAVNSAGIIGGVAPLHELSLEDWQRTLDVNLTGVFLCMKNELRVMRRQDSGAIVNISSEAGLLGFSEIGAYTATKHGILGLTRSAVVESQGSGVRVNAICPGDIDTPMLRSLLVDGHDAIQKVGGRYGRPDEIAEAAVWLCSERSSWVSGDALVVDGGSLAGRS